MKTGKRKLNGPLANASPRLGGRDVGGNTPLKIPYGSKEVALELGARYAAGGWYAPPGVDLAAFREKGWL
jgi:DNA topoisomerase-3